ncbi:hypothetical protein AAFN60_05570 [Roseibacillus persicicus]|uniref:hypothetical protein n=1 Tax=Roseibacillus persicicus TaxID=454148 RepID=UPI00398B4F28
MPTEGGREKNPPRAKREEENNINKLQPKSYKPINKPKITGEKPKFRLETKKKKIKIL